MERLLTPTALEEHAALAPAPRSELEALVAKLVSRSALTLQERHAATRALGPALDALVASAPTAATRDLLTRLLDTQALDTVYDEQGGSCRARVVGALLSLGYPWALEISPEDLELYRGAASSRPRHARSVRAVAVTGGLSVLWNGAWAVLIAAMTSFRADGLLVMAPFVVGALHAMGALAVAGRLWEERTPTEKRDARRLFSVLGWLGLIGPAASAFAASTGPRELFWVGMGFAAPAMITALCCAIAAVKLTPPAPELSPEEARAIPPDAPAPPSSEPG